MRLYAFDDLGDTLSRLTRIFGQLAHFVGDDGKAPARFAGARGFDRCVERQQIGLVGQALDDVDDLADVAGILCQRADDAR